MIYLDNAATTFPKPDCVYEAADRFARTAAVNAGRGAYKAAREAGAMLREIKQELVSLCDARGQAEAVFSPSATVALNQIIQGQDWREEEAAYVTPYEHNAVLRPLRLLEKRAGIRMVELPLKKDLSLDLDKAEKLFRKDPPKLVSATAVSNVTGYVLPFADLFSLARTYGAFTLLDASQAMGLLKLRFAQLKADAVVFAGHKTLYGPFGLAGFLLREGAELNEFIAGGNGQNSLSLDMPPYYPEKLESASTDTVAAAGLRAALEWRKDVDLWQTEQTLMGYLLPRLAELPNVKVYAAPTGAEQAGVVSLNVKGFRANEAAAILDQHHDIAVRAGHHCAALIHRHLKDKTYDGTVRVSVGVFTTKADLDALVDALRGLDRAKLKGIAPDILRGNC